MKRGFPRPRTHIVKLKGWYAGRIPDPTQYENRDYPCPYTANDNDLSIVEPTRVKECTQYKKCIVCGEHVEGDLVWVYRSGHSGKDFQQDSGPFHEKCKDLTIALCPAVKSATSTIKFFQESWAEVGPLIRGKFVG